MPSLEVLHKAGHTISAVVTNTDKRRGRGKEKTATPVKIKALELGLPVLEVDDLKSGAFEDQLRALKPDLLVVVAFRVLPQNILDVPVKGSINLHASLLPKYRGAAPIHWAVINGETETGCTVFFLDEQVDTGNIVSQVKTKIGSDETTGEVYERLMKSGSVQLLEAVNLIASGTYVLLPQNDELATLAPKLNNENIQLDFSEDAAQVHNMIRGLSPVPAARAVWGDKKIKIFKSRVEHSLQALPGELLVKEDRVFAGCGSHSVELLELQLPGKAKITGADFVRGYQPSGKLK